MTSEGERTRRSYLVTQTQEVRLEALSASDARAIAVSIFQLRPNSKTVTTNIHVEEMRD